MANGERRITPEELDKRLMVAIDTAQKAGDLLMNYFVSGKYGQIDKGGNELVTGADIQADELIREEILKSYPAARILTEESTSLEQYDSLRHGDLWVVDPLDGTVNFSRGCPNFAVSIALVQDSQTVMAVVYKPATRDTYFAKESSDDAFLNGNPIHVSSVANLAEASFLCDWVPSARGELDSMLGWLKKIRPQVRQVKSLGSAVADSVTLAEGTADIYLNPGLKPWDLAAAAFIVTKAGGVVTTPEGEQWDIFNPNALITNGVLHKRLLDLLNN